MCNTALLDPLIALASYISGDSRKRRKDANRGIEAHLKYADLNHFNLSNQKIKVINETALG
jgi:hypothetical protein